MPPELLRLVRSRVGRPLVVVTVVVLLVTRLRAIDDRRLLWVAFGFQLVLAFGTGLLRHSVPWTAGLYRDWSIVGAWILIFAAVVLVGAPPFEALWLLVEGSFGSASKISATLLAWSPLLLASAGLVVTFAAGLWNIGVEGQIVIGAVAATWVARSLPGPGWVVILVAIVSAVLLGEALAPLGTDWHKEFLEIAPWIVVLFEERYGIDHEGRRRHHYYVKESCGIAAGMFITALHHMGLATLTHTPSPMGFLRELLGRPKNERPFLILVTGYPADAVEVPDIQRKPLDSVISWRDGAD